MKTDQTVHELIKEDMDRALAVCRAEVERAMFQPSPLLAYLQKGRPPYVPPPLWKQRWWKVKGYLQTLWLAIKGVDLVEPSDDWDD